MNTPTWATRYPANAERAARRAGANAQNARLYDEYIGRCFRSEITNPMPAAMWLEHTTKLVTL